MAEATKRSLLNVFPSDVEHYYQTFLRITEVCQLAIVSRTFHKRVHVLLRIYPRQEVHCESVDPGPIAWLNGIAKRDINLRSIKVVRST